MTERIRLKADDIWVSCSVTEFPAAGRERHIIKRGHITTVCGTTASLPEIWRQNKAKPRCNTCVEKYQSEKNANPVKSKKKTQPPAGKQTMVVPKTISAADLRQITEDLDELHANATAFGDLISFEIHFEIGSAKVKASYDKTMSEWELEFL